MMDLSNTSGSSGRNRIPSYSAESSNSATSSLSSENSSNIMMAMIVNKQFTSSNCNSTSSDEHNLHTVVVVYPNGYNTIKKIDSKKPVYDLLIELSAQAKLIPTNYTLNLYHHVENSVDDNYEKKLEYTPNQTIGQLNPTKIEILPKTTTLKHQQQLKILSPSMDNSHSMLNSCNNKRKRFLKSSDYSTNKNYSMNLSKSGGMDYLSNKSSTINISHQTTLPNHHNLNHNNNTNSNYVTPFELTIRIEVNLPFNQKTTVRVRPDIELNNLFDQICKEANLEKEKYQLTLTNYNLDDLDMNNKLSFYDTKEVNLIFNKQYNHLYVAKTLKNKKCNNSILNHLYRKNNQHNQNLTKKSKSEIDLSSDSINYACSNVDLANKTNSLWKKSNNHIDYVNNHNDHLKTTTSRYSMFSFFSSTNKKNLNQSATLAPTKSMDMSIENTKNEKMKYMTTNLTAASNINKIKTFTYGKKKHAPPPPSIAKQIQPIDKKAENNSNDNKNNSVELDYETIRKMINLTKKKKKLAPPPPPPEPKVEDNNSLIQVNDKKIENSLVKLSSDDEKKINESLVVTILSHSNTINFKKSLKKLLKKKSNSLNNLDQLVKKSSSNDNINRINNKHTSNDNLKVINRLKTKLSLDSNWKDLKKSMDESFSRKSNLLNKEKIITSSLMSNNSPNFKESININLSISTIDDVPNSYCVAEEKILTITEKLITKTESAGIEEPINNLSESKSPSIKSEKSHQNDLPSPPIDFQNHSPYDRPIYESTTDDNFFFGLNRNNQNQPGGLQFENKIYDLNNTINRNKFRKLEKRQFTIEVRPKLETIINYQNYDEQSNLLDLNSKYMRNNEIYEMGLEPTKLTIRTEIDHSLSHHFLDSITSPRINETSHLKSIFCSPSSPLPQFPAINESEINEIHGNYTVVRSGAIIEKNGTYYSNDGTIRGFSGTVKKMANSKTLNEIFSNRNNELNKQSGKSNQFNNVNNNSDNVKTYNFTKPSPLSPVTEVISPVPKQPQPQTTPVTQNKKEPKINSSTLSSNSNIFKKAPFSTISKTLPNKNQDIQPRPKSSILIINNNSEQTDNIKSSRLSTIIYNSNNNISTKIKQCDINNHAANIALINQEILSTFKPALPPRKDQPQKISVQSQPPSFATTPSPPNQFKSQSCENDNNGGFDKMNINNVLINDYIKKNLQLNNDSITLDVSNDEQVKMPLKNQENIIIKNLNINHKKQPTYIANISVNPTNINKPQPPKVAPKNFSFDTIESINKKNNVLSIRENLMDSIKNFNIANLRSSSINT